MRNSELTEEIVLPFKKLIKETTCEIVKVKCFRVTAIKEEDIKEVKNLFKENKSIKKCKFNFEELK